jgi:tetratricopeptide (TPR) repeat protein
MKYIVLLLALLLASCAKSPRVEVPAQGALEVPKINMAAELAKIDTMLIADSPNAISAHESYLRALDMMEDGRIALAELFYKRALAYEPTSHFLLTELIRILLRQNKTSEAFPLSQLAVRSPKATGEDLLFMARLYKEKKMLDSSAANYKKAMDKIKGNLNVLYEYAQLLEFMQDYPELKRIYDILLPELDYPYRLMEKQILLYQITNTPDSVVAELLGEAFRANGMNHAEYGYWQAQILVSMGKYSEANEVLLTIFFMHPSQELTSRIALSISHNYELMDSITAAIVWLEQLITREPNNHTALNNLGYILIDRDMDVKRGISLVEKALKFSPDEFSYLDSKAWGLYKIGKYEESLKIFEKLETYGIDAKELWEHLAAVCEALKLEERAKGYRAKIKD